MAYTLDDIRAAAEKKYGSTDFDLGDGEVLSLINPLRLPKEKRKALLKIQDQIDSEEVEHEDVLADAIRLVASNKVLAEKLIEECGDDMAMLAEIFSLYTGDSQVGEASASQS